MGHAANLLIDKLAGCNLSRLCHSILPKRALLPFSITICLWGMSNSRLSNIIWQPVKCYSVAKGTREEIYEFMMGDLDDEVTKYLPQRVSHSRDAFAGMLPPLRAKIILFHR